MRTTVGCLLALALALPAHALAPGNDKKDEKKKDTKKKGPSAEETLALADQKVAAGDVAGALELIRDAASFDSAPGEVTLRLGVLRELNHELDIAIETYKAAAEKLTGPGKGEALGRMSVAQEVFGPTEATATADAAIAADPAGVWPTIALSRARSREKKGDEAAALAQKAVAAGGGAPASAALGFAQEARGDLAAAETAYRAAIAAEPGRVDSSVGLARVLRRTGRAADADPILQEVIKAAPGAIEAYKESARVKLALGRPAAAKGDAATAAVLAEGDPEAQLLMQQVTVATALAYLPAGQVDTAIQELTALRDKDPNFVDARIGLAKALLAKRRDDAAVLELQKAIELAPENAEAYFQLGFVNHAAKHNAAGALPAYEKAVALDPASVEYRTNLGAVLAELNQYDRAVAELTKVTTSPGYSSAAAWIYLGGAQLAAKKYKEASAALEKAIAIAPEEVMGQAYMAWSCLGLKDAASFKKYGAKARSLGYKDPTFLERLSKVEAGEAIK